MARGPGPIGEGNYPQLGGEAERHHVTSSVTGKPKYSEAGNPETALTFPGGQPNIGHPETFQIALSNFLHSVSTSPKRYRQTGEEWYPKVHEAVAHAVSGGFLSGHSDPQWAGAGVVAAVSPGMDWERNNIHALTEIQRVTGRQWNEVLGRSTARNALSPDDARKAYFGKTSISQATLPQLQKAGSIIHLGMDPHEALPFETSPKTHSFAHNIHDPSDVRFATVDGRAFDTMTNRVRPWEYSGRGINKADLKTPGLLSRYEHSRNVIIAAAHQMGIDPSSAQAISWEHVKQHIERAGVTKAGTPRQTGPERLGQPYFHPETGVPAAHDLDPYRHLQFDQFVSPYER
jgi:hypothetical protein